MPRKYARKSSPTSPGIDALGASLAAAIQPLIAAEVRAQLSQIAREWLSKNAQPVPVEVPSVADDVPVAVPVKNGNGAKKHVSTVQGSE